MAFLLCNMDRVNMSVSIISMAEQYGWDRAAMGIVQSSFFWGYLLTQVRSNPLNPKSRRALVAMTARKAPSPPRRRCEQSVHHVRVLDLHRRGAPGRLICVSYLPVWQNSRLDSGCFQMG